MSEEKVEQPLDDGAFSFHKSQSSVETKAGELDGLTDIEAVIELERQLLAEQQVSAGLRVELEIYKSRGTSSLYVPKAAYDAFKIKAEASLAEANAAKENWRTLSKEFQERCHELKAELATLKAQEAPEKAWERGWKAGYETAAAQAKGRATLAVRKYTPPAKEGQ